ncbi:hypothetical protein LTR54_013789 [Friedmanniomyces endolithicus]|uniref:Methyltransferase domain-containing protein n=1 Tax=Friedmanniomyces endolithicus TaxID=329885 RepID=A0AAN6J6Z1_9PEZI|nr:hypothetical protein LTR82_009901 [Friedmanniomyces endolithicus]KAK0985394.1 hypothetical protein LTR54_013789 [Friedmanniomyces endolithicus]
MADFSFNPAAANKASQYYDGHDYEVELSALPRTRAPSYTPGNSAFQDEDDISLINDRKSSKSGLGATERVVRVVSQTPTAASNRQKRRRLQGWRFGVACSATMASSVLILNLILAIVAAVKFGSENGVGTAFTGSCATVNSWATWLHIVINALSSLLLSASNYTMQCLCSPTRKEIDKAHAKGDWMDVGVASVRNIWRVRWTRGVLWWCLALSSVPIHLLYNSAIFKTLDANDFSVATVNSDFLNGEPFYPFYPIPPTYSSGYQEDGTPKGYFNIADVPALRKVQSFFAQNYQNASAIQNLTNSDCIAAYGTSFISGHSHLLLVTSQKGNGSNHTVFSYEEIQTSSGAGPNDDWICTDSEEAQGTTNCDISGARNNAATWTMYGAPIEYCLAQIAPSHCKLQFSMQILITVILMNVCKSACMFLTLYRQKDATLVTIGDALSSFLDRPDPLTKDRCLMAKVDVHNGPLRWRASGVKNTPNTKPLPVTYYAPLRRRWFAGATVLRWCITIGLCTAALITAGTLLGIGVGGTQTYLSGQSVFSLGFGAVDSRSLIDVGLPQYGASGLLSSVLLANLPQAIVSFLYLTYNGLFTSMLLCHEYSKYAMDGRRKPLRVTTPHGQQRTTYYLQLPYTYSLPLLVTSGTLHWLISQSIFLARISIYNDGVNSDQDDYSEVGYSCTPILCVVLLGTAMLVFALGMGCRKFASSMPVAGSCSVALAAACHPPKRDEDASFLPVRWGEVADASGEEDEVRHCSFTSGEVQAMTPGRLIDEASTSLFGLRSDLGASAPAQRDRLHTSSTSDATQVNTHTLCDIMAKSTKDHWSAEKYSSAADFVPKLTTTVLSYLNVQPGDHILDIGCGDGQLTVQIAASASSGKVLGLDASQSFISTAQQKHNSQNCEFELHDCTHLAQYPDAVNGSWDKVFSNAALHWILRNPDTRVNVFRDAHKALKSGGKLVFEMGGKGNVAEVQAAFTAALMHAGLPIEAAREAKPWFFPSVEWMSTTLSEVGFEVEKCELEYRPTKCSAENADGSGGLVGWLRLMGAQFLDAVGEGKREAVLREVCEILETVVTREEDGSKWLGYTRLRAVARKL